MNSPVLNGWKEIAEYVGRGIRTVQRWERELGLPVKRPRNHLRSPVVAIPSEIDEWLRRRISRSAAITTKQEHGSLLAKGKELNAKSKVLYDNLGKVDAALHQTMKVTRVVQRGRASLPSNHVHCSADASKLQPRKTTAPKPVKPSRNGRPSAWSTRRSWLTPTVSQR